MRWQIINDDGSITDSVKDLMYPEAEDRKTVDTQILLYSLAAMEEIIPELDHSKLNQDGEVSTRESYDRALNQDKLIDAVEIVKTWLLNNCRDILIKEE